MDTPSVSKLNDLRNQRAIYGLERPSTLMSYRAKTFDDKVHVVCFGGIGDLILSIPVIERMNYEVDGVVIYTKMPEIAKLFTTLEVRTEDEFYAVAPSWCISIATMPVFQFTKQFKAFERDSHFNLFVRYRSFVSEIPWNNIVSYQPFMDNLMAEEALKLGLNRRTLPFAMLGYEPVEGKYDRSTGVFLYDSYITVHNGFDVSKKSTSKRSTKNWDLTYWAWLVREIKMSYPKLMVIQLGTEKSGLIPGCDRYQLDTPFGETLNTLSRSLCHIDGESGLVHAAAMMDVPSIVMFGPTNVDFFKYEKNINIQTSVCRNCWWLTDDWMDKCPAGHPVPTCMQENDPYFVFRSFQEKFKGRL